MAVRAGKFSKRAQESTLGQIVDEVLRAGTENVGADTGSELDFIESPQGLGLSLYPLQRIIVKATFGIPLDYKPVTVPIWDTMKENLLYEFTEEEAVRWLYDQGRCNVCDWNSEVPEGGFGTVVAYAGRRGGKSEIVAAISGAMLRNLLGIDSPQRHYALADGSVIDFSFMGTDDTGAQRIYTKLRQRINAAPFFNPFIRVNNVDEMQFVTRADRGNRDVLPSINVKAYPCTTQAARGPSNYFLALDEFQFFRSSKETNSEDVFKAATPSTAQFAPPDDPETPDSKVLVISSPANKVGKMYELHATALSEGAASGIFTMRLSTVELNPRIPRNWLIKELKQNAATFKAEIGGDFLDGSGSYVPEAKFNLCIDRERPNQVHFDPSAIGRKFFWGLDLAMKNDGTGLAIGHLELTEGKGIELIFDYVDRMICGESFTGPGVIDGAHVKDLTELNLTDIIAWLFHMHQILPCFKGLTDQHAGAHFKQLLQLNGITAMELVHLNDQINSKMYFALQGFINHVAARFPHNPRFEIEFKMLEASFRNKYVLKVEAPQEKGAHDDMSDACAIVAMLAQQWLEEEGNLDLDPTAKILQINPFITPNQPVVDPSGVSIRDLQVLDRMRRIQQTSTLGADMIGLHRMGRHGRRF
jgi:hypothetical protein